MIWEAKHILMHCNDRRAKLTFFGGGGITELTSGLNSETVAAMILPSEARNTASKKWRISVNRQIMCKFEFFFIKIVQTSNTQTAIRFFATEQWFAQFTNTWCPSPPFPEDLFYYLWCRSSVRLQEFFLLLPLLLLLLLLFFFGPPLSTHSTPTTLSPSPHCSVVLHPLLGCSSTIYCRFLTTFNLDPSLREIIGHDMVHGPPFPITPGTRVSPANPVSWFRIKVQSRGPFKNNLTLFLFVIAY